MERERERAKENRVQPIAYGEIQIFELALQGRTCRQFSEIVYIFGIENKKK